VHAHHVVFPEPHAKWRKVERFLSWLRLEACRTSGVVPARTRGK
jgi:hypothetical protein